MSIFRDPDCLDRVSASLGAIAGVCSVVPAATPIAVSAGLLSMASGGISAWRGRLQQSSSDANNVLVDFMFEYKRNWREWARLTKVWNTMKVWPINTEILAISAERVAN